jgi:peptidoglycan/xylan/chitin deacetylase (PgdA/CDA1 family)
MRVRRKINVPILTYHSIDRSGSVISTAPEVFARQMEYLHRNGYRVLSLSEFVSALTDNHTPLVKTVALTFDDGFHNFFSEAFPVLERYGFRATVFLVTDFCGGHNDWAGNPPELPRSRLLGWSEIKELDRYGIEFGSHTRTHPDLTRIFEEEIFDELVESKQAIEDALGKEAASFAYPFGRFNREARHLAGRYFKAACSTSLGKVQFGSDLFSLERIDTYYLSNQKIFEKLSDRSFDLYMKFRHALRSFKAAVTQH